MKPFGLLVVFALLAFAAPLGAQQPEVSLQVVEMSPASPAVLHNNERPSGGGSGGLGAVSVGIAGLVAVAIGGAALVAGLAWPVWGVVRWTGGWRLVAAVPLAAAVVWAVKDVVDLVRDSTSHNLLPFEFVIGAFLALPYMLVVSIWRRLKRKGTNG